MFGLFDTGFNGLYWGHLVMFAIGGILVYLGIARKYDPLLLIPIGFSIILVNIPNGDLMKAEGDLLTGEGAIPIGLFARILHYGVQWEIIPPLVFLGLGAMTDFSPLIANPKTLLLGAAAQLGIYLTMFATLLLNPWLGFDIQQAAAIGIIGGADGPTTIYIANRLAPELLGVTAVASYSYMALVALIQPPIIRLLTSKRERAIYMEPQLREVSRLERLLFPVIGTVAISMLVPQSAPLIGSFMFGNLLREVPGTRRLADTAAGPFMDVLVLLLGFSIGGIMTAENFLVPKSLAVLVLGVIAFGASTAFGVLMGKVMNYVSKEPINPIIGAAGVSAVPMSARVVQRMGQQANPRNFLLMHAMGPNIAGVIGTAVAAGVFLGLLGK